MSSVVRSATAQVMQAANDVLRKDTPWPDTSAGFAYRICSRTGTDTPEFMRGALRSTTTALLRRTPELAAFGYVIESAAPPIQAIWLEAVEHLRGRDIYPADRQSFIFNPAELLGIASGIAAIAKMPDGHGEWMVSTIQRGFNTGQFRTPVSAIAAEISAKIINSQTSAEMPQSRVDLSSLETSELVLIAGIYLGFGQNEDAEVSRLEQAIIKRILEREIQVNDAAEAITLSIVAQRAADGIALRSAQSSPLDLIETICRRFPLLIRSLGKRQRQRTPVTIKDEYDVQDFLLAVLRLHFDDVRPEEWTPSYAGNSSKVDFLLPKEKIIVEAKMMRDSLSQKEVINQLIIDCGRYSNHPSVNTLVCLIYDPNGKCQNPAAIENDIQSSGSRLNVKVIVCPRGL